MKADAPLGRLWGRLQERLQLFPDAPQALVVFEQCLVDLGQPPKDGRVGDEVTTATPRETLAIVGRLLNWARETIPEAGGR